MAFLKTVFIILLVYYLLKILARWFAPKIFSYAAKKTEAHFRSKFEEFQEQHSGHQQSENGTTTHKKSKFKTNPSKKVGEYIDFEEID